jgi:hypothetical protein
VISERVWSPPRPATSSPGSSPSAFTSSFHTTCLARPRPIPPMNAICRSSAASIPNSVIPDETPRRDQTSFRRRHPSKLRNNLAPNSHSFWTYRARGPKAAPVHRSPIRSPTAQQLRQVQRPCSETARNPPSESHSLTDDRPVSPESRHSLANPIGSRNPPNVSSGYEA